MKFSERWLCEWINTTLDSKILYNQITMAGLEVDNVKPVAAVFSGVIIGEVIECNQHPNIKELYINKVNIGNNRLLSIACDKPNCRKGLKVVVADVNSTLPEVKLIKAYNGISEGILCSFSELGISGYCKGIIELPVDAPIGTDIREYLELEDNSIEINVTSNRADCLSIIGIARDVAIFNNTKLSIPNIIPAETTINDTLSIQVEVPDACPRYLGRIIKNIDINISTPLWMKEKLRRSGIHSVNVVIDITNYVLLELGQPIHVFDINCINGGIVVRMAKEGETLVLFNGNQVKLCTNTLVIADHNKILAIGGVLVGEYFCINQTTKDLLLECAFFNPFVIIGKARYYGLHTDASCRYERGVDPTLQYKAMERVTSLLLNICHGSKAGPIIDITDKTMLPKCPIIILRRHKLDRLIGQYITDAQVDDILWRLGCKVVKVNQQWHITVPSWRFDLRIEEDLIEEIIRIYGYDNIYIKTMDFKPKRDIYNKTNSFLKRAKIMLNDKGYQEIITYSFVDPKLQELIHPGKPSLAILNPISNEMSTMRISLWSGLLNTIIYNQSYQQKRMRFFESGLCFVPDMHTNLGVRQDLMLAGAIYGNRYEDHWDLVKNVVDFYDIKGDLEALFDLTGKLSEVEFRAQIIPALHYGQSAAIYLADECIGFVGVIHPEIERKLNLNNRTIIFELNWNKVGFPIITKVEKISTFPIARRDIAIIVSESISAGDVLAECKKINSTQVIDVRLFDVYRGKGVPDGYKSLAISLIFQDKNRTLIEEEIIFTVKRCLEVLKKRFMASLRD